MGVCTDSTRRKTGQPEIGKDKGKNDLI